MSVKKYVIQATVSGYVYMTCEASNKEEAKKILQDSYSELEIYDIELIADGSECSIEEEGA